MLETFQPLRSVREHFHRWTCPDQLLNCACPAHQPSCFDGDALKHKCPQFMTKPLQTISTLSFFSLCRWQLLGVWCRAADPGARVHQDFGSVGIGDPGGPTLGPRLHLWHLLLQVGQLLEVQPPPKPCGVCLPEKHAGLERHPQRCGRLFQGHLWYETTLVYWDLDNRHMACAEAPHWVTINATYSAPLSGYAHFIRGRQYWKFDPVGMNSLEGYPRYVGVDFFGCRNAWVTLRRIRNTFPPDFFGIEEENLGSGLLKAMKPSL